MKVEFPFDLEQTVKVLPHTLRGKIICLSVDQDHVHRAEIEYMTNQWALTTSWVRCADLEALPEEEVG